MTAMRHHLNRAIAYARSKAFSKAVAAAIETTESKP